MKSDRHLRFNHQRRPDERTDIIAACCLAGRVSVLLTSARRHPTVTTASHTRLPRRGLAGTRGDSMLAVSGPGGAAPPARPPARGRHGARGRSGRSSSSRGASPRGAAAAVAYAAVARGSAALPGLDVHRLPASGVVLSRAAARRTARAPPRCRRGCPRHRRRHGRRWSPSRSGTPSSPPPTPSSKNPGLRAPRPAVAPRRSARHLRREDRARAPVRGVHAEGSWTATSPWRWRPGWRRARRDAAERRPSRSRRPVPRVPRLAKSTSASSPRVAASGFLVAAPEFAESLASPETVSAQTNRAPNRRRTRRRRETKSCAAVLEDVERRARLYYEAYSYSGKSTTQKNNAVPGSSPRRARGSSPRGRRRRRAPRGRFAARVAHAGFRPPPSEARTATAARIVAQRRTRCSSSPPRAAAPSALPHRGSARLAGRALG